MVYSAKLSTESVNLTSQLALKTDDGKEVGFWMQCRSVTKKISIHNFAELCLKIIQIVKSMIQQGITKTRKITNWVITTLPFTDFQKDKEQPNQVKKTSTPQPKFAPSQTKKTSTPQPPFVPNQTKKSSTPQPVFAPSQPKKAEYSSSNRTRYRSTPPVTPTKGSNPPHHSSCPLVISNQKEYQDTHQRIVGQTQVSKALFTPLLNSTPNPLANPIGKNRRKRKAKNLETPTTMSPKATMKVEQQCLPLDQQNLLTRSLTDLRKTVNPAESSDGDWTDNEEGFPDDADAPQRANNVSAMTTQNDQALLFSDDDIESSDDEGFPNHAGTPQREEDKPAVKPLPIDLRRKNSVLSDLKGFNRKKLKTSPRTEKPNTTDAPPTSEKALFSRAADRFASKIQTPSSSDSDGEDQSTWSDEE